MSKPVVYESVKAKDREEAIAKSSMKVGQLLRISDLQVSGTVNGEWTIIPKLETVDDVPATSNGSTK